MRIPDISTTGLTSAVLLLIFGILAVVAEVIPLGLGPTASPSPDLLFGVVAFWAIRRPNAAPILLVATLGLFRDLMSDVPAGAGALVLVLATEALKRRSGALVRSSFLLEWLTVAAAAALCLLSLWLLVLMTFLQPPYLLTLAHQWLFTVMVYPLIALVLRWFFGVGRRQKPALNRTG